MEEIKQLVTFLVTELVDNKDKVVIQAENETIKVSVDKSDMGKIIGRQGKIAKSIRTVVKAAASKKQLKISVDILEAE